MGGTTWIRYLELELDEARKFADNGVALLGSGVYRSSAGLADCDRFSCEAEESGFDAGSGVDTPNALASFASLCGGRGDRGDLAEAAVTGNFLGETPAIFGRFGVAGAVNGETYTSFEDMAGMKIVFPGCS